jgi:hypothetical protein
MSLPLSQPRASLDWALVAQQTAENARVIRETRVRRYSTYALSIPSTNTTCLTGSALPTQCTEVYTTLSRLYLGEPAFGNRGPGNAVLYLRE